MYLTKARNSVEISYGTKSDLETNTPALLVFLLIDSTNHLAILPPGASDVMHYRQLANELFS